MMIIGMVIKYDYELVGIRSHRTYDCVSLVYNLLTETLHFRHLWRRGGGDDDNNNKLQ